MLNSFRALDRVLKGDATHLDSLRGGSIPLPLGGLSFLIVLLGAVYGGCMGAFALMARWGTDTQASGFLQMLASAAKVPMLFVLTLLVTFPSLYVFNALVGSRLAFASVGRLMVGALAVTMAVLASFGTILVFFSLCTTSYPFIVLLNVAMFAIAGLLGMRFLLQTLQRLATARAIADAEAATTTTDIAPADTDTPPPAYPPAEPADVPPLPGALGRLHGQSFGDHVKTVFRIWIIVFGLVGAQMGWVLRPFIGSPNQPFTFFRERDSNFFEAVVGKVGDLFSGSDTKSRGGWRKPKPDTPPQAPTTNPSSYNTDTRP